MRNGTCAAQGARETERPCQIWQYELVQNSGKHKVIQAALSVRWPSSPQAKVIPARRKNRSP